MMGETTEERGDHPFTGIMLYQTSTQEVLHTEPINENMKKGNVRIMNVGNNILAATEEAIINEN